MKLHEYGKWTLYWTGALKLPAAGPLYANGHLSLLELNQAIQKIDWRYQVMTLSWLYHNRYIEDTNENI